MQCLHHLLELADACKGVVRVGAVGPFGHVVVHRVVTPVELRRAQACLVNRAIVVGRQYMDGVHAEVLQVFDGPRLCQGEEFAGIFGLAGILLQRWRERCVAGYGVVAVVHLVYHQVAGRLQLGPLVLAPSFGVGFGGLVDVAALAVHAHCRGKHARSLYPFLLVSRLVDGVELALEVAFHGSFPVAGLLFVLLQLDGFHRLAAQSLVVEAQHHALGIGIGIEAEVCSLLSVPELMRWLARLCLAALFLCRRAER